jgi:hypothetical protein
MQGRGLEPSFTPVTLLNTDSNFYNTGGRERKSGNDQTSGTRTVGKEVRVAIRADALYPD